MTEREGVIKFDLEFHPGPVPAAEMLVELEAWRTIFRHLGLMGQDPGRYGGLGFGNLSRRIGTANGEAFIISGTQTGLLERLCPEHYATVTACDPQRNRVTAHGVTRPSSEALSHAVLYQADRKIDWVMHLHAPEIFTARQHLALPATNPEAPYGSPAMAAEIARLAPQSGWPGLMVMGGHEDGILAFGATAPETGSLVVNMLAAALAAGGMKNAN